MNENENENEFRLRLIMCPTLEHRFSPVALALQPLVEDTSATEISMQGHRILVI